MDKRKGFTLVELMVVILIVGILAAVAVPMMRGRVDAAKWTEGKAGAGSVASAIRAYCAENGTEAVETPSLTGHLHFAPSDLEGTYFAQSNYAVSGVDCTDEGLVDFLITVTASTTKTGAPTDPPSMTLTSLNSVETWADGT